MKKTIFAAAIVGSTLFITVESHAQVKAKIKTHKKEVRFELEKQYNLFVQATMQKDSALACSLVHPEAIIYTPNGETWDAKQSCAYMALSFRVVDTTYKVSFGLDTIQVSGDTASVLIHQYWHRAQMKAGKIREVETTADQWETWVKRNGQYLRYKIDRVKPKIWKVDGKRIDPSKPYDPNAPEIKG